MFLADPALRRIAAVTNEVLPDQMWRHDTAVESALGDLARILHKTALSYNTTTGYLDQTVRRLTGRPHLNAAGYGDLLLSVLAAIERHGVLADMLLDTYRAWRRYRPIGVGGERYLLLYPGNPVYGVAVLHGSGEHTWLVSPDAEAANAFNIPYAGRTVGQVTQNNDGWKPTAHTNPTHLQSQPAMTYPLPVCDDLTRACRSLLRWWRLRHSAAWRSRTPDQLTEDELAQLTA